MLSGVGAAFWASSPALAAAASFGAARPHAPSCRFWLAGQSDRDPDCREPMTGEPGEA